MSENIVQDLEDRRLIRELVDHYAYYADQCEVDKQVNLFTEDTVYIVDYLDNPEAQQTITGRESLRPLFQGLTEYHTKTHFNGQSTVYSIEDGRATGVAYCLAHHITLGENGQQENMVASIRYDDQYRKENGRWLFARRYLSINWVENR